MSCSRLPDQPAEVALGDIGQAGRASHVDRAEIVRGRKLEEASPGTWERLGVKDLAEVNQTFPFHGLLQRRRSRPLRTQ